MDASEIEAQASDGEVTLEGSVTDHAQKRIAEQDARDVVGVAWVTNNLFVKTDQPEDWTIRDDVDFNLKTDSVLAPFDLESRVKDGVVTLAGRVHDWSEQVRARPTSPDAFGLCREVVNEIRVQPATGTITKHSDATVAKEIRDSFRRHWATSRVADRIRVGVKDGVATLTGDLDTWDERLEAGRRRVRHRGCVEGPEPTDGDGLRLRMGEVGIRGALLLRGAISKCWMTGSPQTIQLDLGGNLALPVPSLPCSRS